VSQIPIVTIGIILAQQVQEDENLFDCFNLWDRVARRPTPVLFASIALMNPHQLAKRDRICDLQSSNYVVAL